MSWRRKKETLGDFDDGDEEFDDDDRTTSLKKWIKMKRKRKSLITISKTSNLI